MFRMLLPRCSSTWRAAIEAENAGKDEKSVSRTLPPRWPCRSSWAQRGACQVCTTQVKPNIANEIKITDIRQDFKILKMQHILLLFLPFIFKIYQNEFNALAPRWKGRDGTKVDDQLSAKHDLEIGWVCILPKGSNLVENMEETTKFEFCHLIAACPGRDRVISCFNREETR